MNMKRNRRLLACLGLVALSGSFSAAWAQVAPSLGSLSTYGIASSTFTNTGPGTTINGDVCFTTGPAFPATVSGTTGPCPASAGTDQSGALAILNGQACTALPAGNLDAVVIGANPPGVIPPGCYFRAGSIDITANGIVTLTGNGVYIFRSTGGAVTTGANSQVLLAGGACAGNVFWAPVGATTLGATSSFVGNILDAAGITIGLGAAVQGRALAFGGTVTTNASTITVPAACAAPPPPVPPGIPAAVAAIPTLSEWAMIALAMLLAMAGFAAIRKRSR
jgi:ice-binding like protein/exosortase sorting signal-containing protein